jgi:hypothetical protein
LAPDFHRAAEVVGDLARRGAPTAEPSCKGGLTLVAPKELEVSTLQRREAGGLPGLLSLGEATEEVAALFEPSSEEDNDLDVFSERGDAPDSSEPSGDVWCDTALSLDFEQGWTGLFAADDMVNVVVSARGSLRTDERYVRSIQSGDRVLLIHGSRRQNLYDLIVERVHRHPAIELHLALLRRWRDDFKDAIHRWSPKTLDDLLHALQAKGSRLTSAGTLYHWLRGWTLCPQDATDILRAAETLNMPFLQKNHGLVAKAATRVRGLHIGLSIRLSRWLSDPHQSAQAGAGDDFIDEKLGLTFNDFRSSIVVVSVLRVTSLTGPFLRSGLGRVSQKAS